MKKKRAKHWHLSAKLLVVQQNSADPLSGFGSTMASAAIVVVIGIGKVIKPAGAQITSWQLEG